MPEASRRRFAAVTLVALVQAGPARAEETAFDPAQWPYTAIGKLNVVTGANRRRFCTASLIGPRLALSAAHCLWDEPRKRWVTPAVVHFVAGWAQGRYLAHAVASAYRTGPDYLYGTAPANLARDWALIELAEAIPVKPIALEPASAEGDPDIGSDIRRAGYSRDRSERMSAQGRCSARATAGPEPLLLHACRAIPGESGSALLRTGPAGPMVIGILVAGRTEQGAEDLSVAVPVRAFREAAEALLRAQAEGKPGP
ncbi:trypsin-like serine peptidase [Methylobacterium trifolii]|uniref:Serine protease n=1 Tax=Methylobacterium trifolii TaxID=1003092 RepID=A0ABQ4U2I1_9HYPH|nr:trypsin-like serine protease [Methylobacterium trifolii]GJE61389.1 hypothetical protein MPOCJGCO_3511 [Methylobacterium trifolii]